MWFHVAFYLGFSNSHVSLAQKNVCTKITKMKGDGMDHIAQIIKNDELVGTEVVAFGLNKAIYILDQSHYWWIALVSLLVAMTLANIVVGYKLQQ